MKILPVVCKLIPLMIEGRCVKVPFQVFRSVTGTMIRIGDNVLHFGDDGTYDGVETKFAPETDKEQIQLYVDALSECSPYRGLAPETAYHQPGTPGFLSEIKGWGGKPITPGVPFTVVVEPDDKTPKS